MRAVYDLARCPVQFDCASNFVRMERERIERGEPGIDLIFAPGPREGFRDNDSWPETREGRELHMERIVIPIARMLPSIRSITRWQGPLEELAGVFGYGGSFYSPAEHYGNLASPHGRPLVCEAEKNDRLITITLRECLHWTQRNSNVAEWVEAAKELERHGFEVVVIRDTRRAHQVIPGVTIDPDAAIYIPARARRYASARLNLFVNSGPMALATYMNAPLLNFRPVCDTHGASSTARLEQCGIKRGGQPPGAPAWQRWVWEEDTAKSIVKAVETMGSAL